MKDEIDFLMFFDQVVNKHFITHVPLVGGVNLVSTSCDAESNS